MTANPQKVQGLVEKPPLKDMKEIQSFLGLLNFMQPFIPRLSHHSASPHEVTGQGKSLYWHETLIFSQELQAHISDSFKNTLTYYDRINQYSSKLMFQRKD